MRPTLIGSPLLKIRSKAETLPHTLNTYIMSPSDIVYCGVRLDITLQVDIVPQVDIAPHEISPESNFCSGSDCNINI